MVIGFTSVQMEVAKNKGFRDFRSGNPDVYIPITNAICEISSSLKKRADFRDTKARLSRLLVYKSSGGSC